MPLAGLWREPVVEDEHLYLMRRLSFADGCMNVVVLPHLLECVSQPALVLHEAKRLLSASGWLFVIGFYPVSLYRRSSPVPYNRRQSPTDLIHILSLLDFRSVRCYPLTTLPCDWTKHIPGLRRAFILSACRHELAKVRLLPEQAVASESAVTAVC